MERSNALDDLATVVSKRFSYTVSLTLAICVAQCVAGHPPRSMFLLLVQIGTPACAPQHRGKSNGRAIGFKCTPRTRYPVAKKTYSKPKKQQQTA